MGYTRKDFMKLMGTLSIGTAGTSLISPYSLLASGSKPTLGNQFFKKNGRSCLFDDGWSFHRGDAPGAEKPNFDDTAWQSVDLPHDWSIEGLPQDDQNQPSCLSITEGKWRFSKGDNMKWKSPSFNDDSWLQVELPSYWNNQSNSKNPSSFGWYRKKMTIPQNLRGKDLIINVGKIADSDETFFNGVRIGGMGEFPPHFNNNPYNDNPSFLRIRAYRVPAHLIRHNHNVIAVRVYNHKGKGGIYASAPTPRVIGPFSPKSPGGRDTGHVMGGIGWYRKVFTLDHSYQNKAASILFEGVYMNADTWINGYYLGNHPYGYTSFNYDITPYLRIDGRANVLSLRVDNAGQNSRWYSGSGIYRHVWLQVYNPVHFKQWGLYVTTPKVTSHSATVEIASTLKNDTNKEKTLHIQAILINMDDKEIANRKVKTVLRGNGETQTKQFINVDSPTLWSPDSPYLYEVQVKLIHEEREIDQMTTKIGIRSIKVSAKHGLTINGKSITLRGGCMHHDNGPLGAAAIDRAEERRVELMKAQGFNAIRTSHNPPSPAFLDACDRLGMLVMEEAFDCWGKKKKPMDYHLYFNKWWHKDLESMVKRDRNHPSIILWSIGNEIPDRGKMNVLDNEKKLVSLVHRLDSTRPVTEAISASNPWPSTAPAFALLDVGGYNYKWKRYEPDHKEYPKRIMMGTETFPKRAFENWRQVDEHPWVLGNFVWSGMDYLGESGIGHVSLNNHQYEPMLWPWYISNCGDIDICGFKKPQSYYRDVLWNQSKLEMAVHAPVPKGKTEKVSLWGWPNEQQSWNWSGSEGKKLKVHIYSRYPAVKLELNGKTLGKKSVSDDTKLTAVFEVSYRPGILRAYGMKDGRVVAHKQLKTAGKPKAIRLTADRSKIHANRNDLSFITIEITDAHGQRVPNAGLPIHFNISGAGKLAAVGNGNPTDMKNFQSPHCRSFRGRCLAVLQPKGAGTGNISLQATAKGIAPAHINVRIEANGIPL